MNAFNNPPQKSWKQLCDRPNLSVAALDASVRDILARVKESGDEALKSLTLAFDKAKVDELRVSPEEIMSAASRLSDDLKSSIEVAAANIEKFHDAQKRERTIVETMQGVKCWRKAVPVEKVGIYIPGGSAPLFSTVLMLGIPAKLAGCREVILCTPPDKMGYVNPAILFAAHLVGIDRVFRIGGAQAIAAMAFGTATVPRVYKIFGPGNQFVTRAKQIVSEEGVAIDMPAGPSELLVIADEFAEPSFIAADLLSQAEHGEDSQVVLVVNEKVDIVRVQREISAQLRQLPRMAIAEKALANSRIVTFSSDERAMDFVNAYAPEHLIINTKNAGILAEKVVNAGSVFLGGFSPESAGDYASGTNHTLPTNGYARAYAGVSLESFLKYITFQEISADGLKLLGPVVEKMAEAELLEGHKMAVRRRLEYLKTN
jgi:histidinol dehydrogenase